MLLNVDGLDKKWNKGVSSDFEGELGWHAAGDVETYCAPLIFRRVNSGRQGEVREFDGSTLGNVGEHLNRRIDDEDEGENRHLSCKKIKLLSMSNRKFRNLLVTSFHKRWELRDIKWPSRTGLMVE
jgi:hypothetical protein